MNTSQKILAAVGTFLVVGVAGAIIFTFIQNNPPVPKFSYDSSDIDGWYESQNGNLQKLAINLGNKYQGDEPVDRLPVTDMTVHHGEKDAEEAPADNCFTAFSYFDYPLEDLVDTYKEYEKKKIEQGGDLEVLEPIETTIKTFEGDKDYVLRQYSYTIKDEDVLSGYQVGFAETEKGYIRIEGVCKTADDLELTLPVLKAVTLNEH